MRNKDLFDKILTHEDVTHNTIANTFLHFHNAHPESIKKYNLKRNEKYLLTFKFRIIILLRVVQSIFDKKHYYYQEKSSKSDVLFISHLTNNQQIHKSFDTYFGNLPTKLFEKKIDCSIALINHTGVNEKEILTGWRESNISRFVLSQTLSFGSEIALYFSQKKSIKQLKRILSELSADRAIQRDIIQRQVSFGTLNTLRIAKQISSIVKENKVKYIVTTFEGHAWERLVYFFVRKIDPSIKCLGYQHAAIFKYQHAIKRPLAKKFNPDYILTAGQISKLQFSNSKMKKIKTICIGSPRHNNSYKSLIQPKKCCLVIPEGFISESVDLFKFSLSLALTNKHQKFIWRLHPLLSFKKLKKRSSIFKNLPKNIYLSNQDLNKDIEDCDSVLYRGSTAVLEAISNGLMPIYYKKTSDELSIDPIHQLSDVNIVTTQIEFEMALMKKRDIGTVKKLKDFALSFYTPIDIDAFLETIDEKIQK